MVKKNDAKCPRVSKDCYVFGLDLKKSFPPEKFFLRSKNFIKKHIMRSIRLINITRIILKQSSNRRIYVFDRCRHGLFTTYTLYSGEVMHTIDIGVQLILRKNPSEWIVTDLGTQFRQLTSVSGIVFCSRRLTEMTVTRFHLKILLLRLRYPN
ncbi:hypothetical protein TNIN_85601 [Trichonephila inaurata madagascariensis]|uniref:Uncharacterized protein n=1 Tax=Trichonephila inaurata madagascariensis TaxID=2747483 RepID=A0A8X7C5P1_9ARAC|nr:hypothetical protein TNIN_85601 [Trichonephila inaurata madagascariensis]